MTDTTPRTQSPHIEATVVRSAEGPFIGQISVDGAITTIEGRTEDGVRRDIIRAVAGVAQHLSHPVRLVARDSLGTQEVAVSPDGYTEALSPVTPAPQASVDFDTIVGLGHGARHDVGQATPDGDDTLVQPARRRDAVSDLDYLFRSPGDEDAQPHEAEPTPAPAPHARPFVPVPPPASAPTAPVVAPVPAARAAGAVPIEAFAPAAAPVAPVSSAPPVAPVTPVDQPSPVPPLVEASAPTPVTESGPLPPAAGDAPEIPFEGAPAPSPFIPEESEEPAPMAVDVPLEPHDRAHLPTLDDFIAARPASPVAPAELGWQGTLRRLSGGLINAAPSPAELERRRAVASVQRSFSGPRTIVVINPKGGAHKTTATMLLASTFGAQRGGYTLAWDNNETRGTLGWRALPARHQNTAVSLLHDLDRFGDPAHSRVGDLDGYVRAQGSAQFDVLASDEDPNATELIGAEEFTRLHETLQRFYRVIVVDTGNNMRAANWLAAVEAADQLVIVSTVREDTAASAAWLVDGLREKGLHEKVEQAVTVLSAATEGIDPQLARRLRGHFGSLTRAVMEVPHDPALVDGGAIGFELLSKRTREAWLQVAAKVAEGL